MRVSSPLDTRSRPWEGYVGNLYNWRMDQRMSDFSPIKAKGNPWIMATVISLTVNAGLIFILIKMWVNHA